MAQVMKGNPSHKQAPPNQPQIMPSGRAAPPGSGMIVGAVINKPVAPTTQVTVPQQPNQAIPPPSVPQAMTVAPHPVTVHSVAAPGMMPGHLPPGMIAVSQAVALPPQNVDMNGAVHQNSVDNQKLANTKEKTPMCLINELARFNKIQHQYTLTDEQGPAHKKTFYVKLKLGDEEYAASGPSIKKAQHAAAGIALDQTQYKHPPPKPPKSHEESWNTDSLSDSITPTVELNALAMKRGEPAVYKPIEMPRPQYYPPPNFDFRGMYNQRYHYPRGPSIFYVSLKVGQREFIGEGRTRQAARHSAADKALKVLRNLPLPAHERREPSPAGEPRPPAIIENNHLDDEANERDALKSEISLVHEIALKRSMAVNFEVTRESGPPHMRTFVTRCTCGELMCEAEGNSKKLSKKRVAEKMLEKLKELPDMPPAVSKPKKNQGNKKKNRNLIKVEKATPDYGVGINPISRLIQIQQAKKEKEPIYTLVAERGLPRRREFVMQVAVGDNICNGVGPNKKLAKRNAAEAMLQLLGYSRPAPQPSKPAIKSEPSQSSGEKKVTFMEADASVPTPVPPQPGNTGAPAGRQLVPGLLLMPDAQRAQAAGTVYLQNNTAGGINRAPGAPVNPLDLGVKFSPQTTAAIAKELLDTGASPTAESITKTGVQAAASQSVVRPKQQLLYLADVLGFQVQFTDFPKGSNKSEYLSLVSLSTTPPQVSHGAGPTIDASHDIAALTALKALSELGLDAVAAEKLDGIGGGDGPHIKEDKKLANSAADMKAEVK